jgi:hypothetical protein
MEFILMTQIEVIVLLLEVGTNERNPALFFDLFTAPMLKIPLA